MNTSIESQSIDLQTAQRRNIWVLVALAILTVLVTSVTLFLGSLNRSFVELSRINALEYTLATNIVEAFEFYVSVDEPATQRAKERAARGILSMGEEFLALNEKTRAIIEYRSTGVGALFWPDSLNSEAIVASEETIDAFEWAFMSIKGVFGPINKSVYAPAEEIVMMRRRSWRPQYVQARDLIAKELALIQFYNQSWSILSMILAVGLTLGMYFLSIRPVYRRLIATSRDTENRMMLQSAMAKFLRATSGTLATAPEGLQGSLDKINRQMQADAALRGLRFFPAMSAPKDRDLSPGEVLVPLRDVGTGSPVLVWTTMSEDLSRHRRDLLPYLETLSSNIAVANEINLRMQVESQRDALQELAGEAFEAMSQLVAIFRSDGTCVLFNNAFRQHLTNYGIVDPRVDLGSISKLRDLIESTPSGNGERIDYLFAAGPTRRITLRYKDQSIFHWSRNPVRQLGYVFLGQDVTSIYNDAATIEHKRRLEVLGQLSGTIAHDTNNLLAVIQGAIELVQFRETLSGESKELLGKAVNAATQAHAMSRRLLMFSRKQDYVPDAVPLKDAFEDLRIYLHGSDYKGVSLRLVDDHAIVLLVDGSHFQSALLNIVNNSAQALVGHGEIVVKATPQQGGNALVRISDNGPGFSQAALESGTKAFFTEKDVGTGLGLAAVESFAMQSNGSIRLFNAPEGGAVVELCLPLAREVWQKAPTSPHQRDAGSAGKLRVLLLEDNTQLRDLLATFLKENGATVFQAKNLGCAVKVLNKSARTLDVVISDIHLPDGNGLDFARSCRELAPSVPIILMTGYSTADLDEVDLEPRFFVMRKPFQLSFLWNMIESEILSATHGEIQSDT